MNIHLDVVTGQIVMTPNDTTAVRTVDEAAQSPKKERRCNRCLSMQCAKTGRCEE